MVITTAQLRLCAGSNPACGVSEIRDGEDLWQWSRLEIRLNAFRRSTIPQKQFIIIIIIINRIRNWKLKVIQFVLNGGYIQTRNNCILGYCFLDLITNVNCKHKFYFSNYVVSVSLRNTKLPSRILDANISLLIANRKDLYWKNNLCLFG